MSLPSRKRAALLQAVGGYVVAFITVVQGLLLIPLYLHYIGPHTYGLWLAAGGILSMLGLMNFGIGSMLIQRISAAYGKRDFDKTYAYFFNGFLVYLAICLLFGLVGWVVSNFIPSILSVADTEADLLKRCFQLALIALVIGVVNECFRGFSQALLRPVVPMVGMILGRILGIVVTVWMLLNAYGLWAIPAGMLVAEGATFVVNLLNFLSLFVRRLGGWRFDIHMIRDYFRTSPVLMLGSAGGTISQEAEPLLITLFLGPEMTTAYMVTRRAADIVFRISNVLVGSTMGPFSHLVSSEENSRIDSVSRQLIFMSFTVGAIGFAAYVAMNEAFVSLWAGELYALDQSIVLMIAIGFFARSIRGMLSQMLCGRGDFSYASLVLFFEGVARVSIAALLLNWLGLIGIPLAFSLSCTTALVLLGYHMREAFGLRYKITSVVRPLASWMMLLLISIALSDNLSSIDSWLEFSVYAAIYLALLSATYLLINWRDCREFHREIRT